MRNRILRIVVLLMIACWLDDTRGAPGDDSQRTLTDSERASQIKLSEAVLEGPKKSDEDHTRVLAIDELARLRAWESAPTLARCAAMLSQDYEDDPRIDPRLRGRPTYKMKYPANAVLFGLGTVTLPGIVDVIAGTPAEAKRDDNLRMTVNDIVGNRALSRDLVIAMKRIDLKPEEDKRLRDFAVSLAPNVVADVARQKPIAEYFRKELSHSDPSRSLKAIDDVVKDHVWGVIPELVERLDLERLEKADGQATALDEQFPAIAAIIGIGPGALPSVLDGLANKERSPVFRKNAAFCVSKIVRAEELQHGRGACRLLLDRMASNYPKDKAARIRAFAEAMPEVKFVGDPGERQPEPTPAEPKKP